MGLGARHTLSMRLLTWNIRAGGGRRTERIAEQVLHYSADVVVLTEFRHRPGARLLELLAPLGYSALIGQVEGPQNCTAVLSKAALEPVTPPKTPASRHRWVAFRLPHIDLTVLGVHVPNQTEIWNKREFLDCLEAFAEYHLRDRAVIMGDLNTAHDEDCEGDPIRAAVYLRSLEQAGWTDAWRLCNPSAREFTWYSHKRNGFRLDHCYVSPGLGPMVEASSYDHLVRTSGLSDHSLLLTTLRD